jgi:hypothetical protein
LRHDFERGLFDEARYALTAIRARRTSKPVLLAAVVSADTAAAALPGPAVDYNFFVTDFASLTNLSFSDTAGSVAVGGNAQLNGYSVASQIAGNPSRNPNPARLVVGGNLTATNGGVGSNASSPPQRGALYVGGTITLSSFTANGGTFAQSLVDFAGAGTLYQADAGAVVRYRRERLQDE